MENDVKMVAEILKGIMDEFSAIMGETAAYGIARRGCKALLDKYRSQMEARNLIELVPPKLLQ